MAGFGRMSKRLPHMSATHQCDSSLYIKGCRNCKQYVTKERAHIRFPRGNTRAHFSSTNSALIDCSLALFSSELQYNFDKYRSPESQRIVTITWPGPSCRASFSAAVQFTPDELPKKRPSSRKSLWSIDIASSSVISKAPDRGHVVRLILAKYRGAIWKEQVGEWQHRSTPISTYHRWKRSALRTVVFKMRG